MRKIALLLAVIMMFAFVGCTSNENQVEDETMANMEKFLHGGDTYTAKLFVEMADTYEGRLDGEEQQSYVFDLRSKDDYDKGHIIGSINMEFNIDEAESLIEKIPSDWTVFIIADNDEEAKALASKLKEFDEQLFVYTIEGGYEALADADGIEKYITTEPGEFADFTRTESKEKFDKVVNSVA